MIDRRRFLKSAGLGAAALAVPTTLGVEQLLAVQSSSGRKPNVLFIVSDDLNDWIGCLGGHPDSITPHIDRLAGRGVLFERAYCSAPTCNPSRASLLTGLQPSTTGVYHNRQPFRMSEKGKDAVTLPQYFKNNGYSAMGAGKITHGKFPDPVSWSAYESVGGRPKPDKDPAKGYVEVGEIVFGPLDVPDEEMQDYRVVQWGIDRLQQKHDRPFFLACGLRKPHPDWHVPRKYFDKFPPGEVTLPHVLEDDLDDVPPMGVGITKRELHRQVVEAGKWREAVAAYLATVNFVDAQVGRLLDALDASGYAENTIVVFWGDQGYHLGEKHHWEKSTLWEEADRAPLLFVVPGMTQPGGRCKRTVSFLDVYPTLVELCGLPPRRDLEGESLVPLLKNPEAPRRRPALTTHKRGNHAVRSERWRYIRYHDGSEELYDMEIDENQWTNLAQDPEYAAVKRDLARWLPETDAPDAPVIQWPKERARFEEAIQGTLGETQGTLGETERTLGETQRTLGETERTLGETPD
jgi:arylsulfatase A-like enzyme